MLQTFIRNIIIIIELIETDLYTLIEKSTIMQNGIIHCIFTVAQETSMMCCMQFYITIEHSLL